MVSRSFVALFAISVTSYSFAQSNLSMIFDGPMLEHGASDPMISATGTVEFMKGGGLGSFAQGIMRGSYGSPAVVMWEAGGPIPILSETHEVYWGEFFPHLYSETGDSYFKIAGYGPGSDPATPFYNHFRDGVYLWDSDTLPVAMSGTIVYIGNGLVYANRPDSAGIAIEPDVTVITDMPGYTFGPSIPYGAAAGGGFVFSSDVASFGEVLYLSTAGFQRVARVGDVAPGSGGRLFASPLGTAVLNYDTQIAFAAALGSQSGPRGIWVRGINFLKVVAIAEDWSTSSPDGTLIDGVPGGRLSSFLPLTTTGRIQDIQFNQEGMVAFAGQAYTGSATINGIWIWSISTEANTVVVLEGQPAPGTCSTFASFEGVYLNTPGDVAFQATLSDGTVGFWIKDTEGLLSLIAKVDDIVLDSNMLPRQIGALSTGSFDVLRLSWTSSGPENGTRRYIADNGDLVFTVSFADSSWPAVIVGRAGETELCPCPCSADFNSDGDSGTDADIADFFACLAGNCCSTCRSVDYNCDGDIGTDGDIEAFFRALAGGPCVVP